MATIEVTSPGGLLHVQVDDQDADLAQYKWHMAGGKGKIGKYAARQAQLDDGPAVTIYMHREIAVRMGLLGHLYPRRGAQGQWHISIDHDDGDKLNNRRINLKLKSRAGQMTNPNDSLRSTNTSGVRGVSWVEARQQWYASVMKNGKTVNLGYWDEKEGAERARQYWDQTGTRLPSRAVPGTGIYELKGRFYARAFDGGRTISLGGSDTAEGAAAIRRSYDAAPDKAAWLREHHQAPQANGSSGHRGVSFLKNVSSRQWQAYVNVSKKRVNLGRYDTAEEAAAARRAWDESQLLA